LTDITLFKFWYNIFRGSSTLRQWRNAHTLENTSRIAPQNIAYMDARLSFKD